MAKDPEYMLSAPAPVFIDRGLDWNDVVSGDGPFSDTNWTSAYRVSAQRGRNKKVYPVKSSFNFRIKLEANERIYFQYLLKGYQLFNRGEKNFDGVGFDRRICQKLSLPYKILRSRPE